MDGFGYGGLSASRLFRGLKGRDDTNSIDICGRGFFQEAEVVEMGWVKRV